MKLVNIIAKVLAFMIMILFLPGGNGGIKFIVLAVLCCVFFIPLFLEAEAKEKKAEHVREVRQRVVHASSSVKSITPDEFFQLRKEAMACKEPAELEGVYILHNHSKNMYYVGQGMNTYKRVNDHFTGHGNGDVYADYKYGDDFTIKMIPLEGSGFPTLNSLERNAIETYDALCRGYNKTRGNRG